MNANTASEQKVFATSSMTSRRRDRPHTTKAVVEDGPSGDVIASSVASQSGSDTDDDDELPTIKEINRLLDQKALPRPRSQSQESEASTIPYTSETGSSLSQEERSNGLNADGMDVTKAFYISDSGSDIDNDDVCGDSSDGSDDGHLGSGKKHHRRSPSVTSSAGERGKTAKRQRVAGAKQV